MHHKELIFSRYVFIVINACLGCVRFCLSVRLVSWTLGFLGSVELNGSRLSASLFLRCVAMLTGSFLIPSPVCEFLGRCMVGAGGETSSLTARLSPGTAGGWFS